MLSNCLAVFILNFAKFAALVTFWDSKPSFFAQMLMIFFEISRKCLEHNQHIKICGVLAECVKRFEVSQKELGRCGHV